MSLPIEWVVGFIEGEGSFSGSQNKLYDSFAPKMSISQKDPVILEEIIEFFAEYDLPFKLSKRINSAATFKEGETMCHIYIYGITRCIKLYDLVRPHMHCPEKIRQAETWRAKLVVIRPPIQKVV